MENYRLPIPQTVSPTLLLITPSAASLRLRAARGVLPKPCAIRIPIYNRLFFGRFIPAHPLSNCNALHHISHYIQHILFCFYDCLSVQSGHATGLQRIQRSATVSGGSAPPKRGRTRAVCNTVRGRRESLLRGNKLYYTKRVIHSVMRCCCENIGTAAGLYHSPAAPADHGAARQR